MKEISALEILKKGTVIPATPLSLRDDGTYNENGQRFLTRYYLEAGAGGIATAVHSTQFEIRNPKFNLFDKVIKTVIDEINSFEKETGKCIVKICGVCGEAKQAVSEAEKAKSYGYDAVLLSPGGLNTLTEEELVERTRQVAKVMPVIAFYLQTAVGGRRFSYDYWEKVCAIDNVVAIKCASFNRYSTIDVVRAVAFSKRKDEIALYTGNDDNIVADLLTDFCFDVNGKETTMRFVGGLLGHWSVWTKRVCEMFEEIKAGKTDNSMLTLAAQITDANGAVFDVANNFKGCIAGIHEILRRQGLMQSVRCLDENEKLSYGQAQELDRVCEMYPHLTDDDFASKFVEKFKIKYLEV